jgi:hypothetical protein
MVTAAVKAIARPHRMLAPVLRVIAADAMIFPAKL